jgi:hypothetical protein
MSDECRKAFDAKFCGPESWREHDYEVYASGWKSRTIPDMSADIERLRCGVDLMPPCEYRRIVHESIDRIEQALDAGRK